MTTKVNERALVLEMLLAVNEEGQYSHLVLRDVLDKYQYLGKQERAFLTRLMEGTLERQLTLDYVIDQFSKTRVKKMKPLIRNLMRMSVYQIMYMDSVPDSAVCNEAVKLARKRGFSGLSGFVNGVLRSVARGWREVRFPNLSVTYSMPEWIDHSGTVADSFYGTSFCPSFYRAASYYSKRTEIHGQGYHKRKYFAAGPSWSEYAFHPGDMGTGECNTDFRFYEKPGVWSSRKNCIFN